MRAKILAAACFALLSAFCSAANAQSTSVVILPGGCGTASYPNGIPYLTIDSTGHLCTSGGSSGGGGTSSNFNSAFPSVGTAVGMSNGTNMVPFLADGSGNLKVNIAAGSAGGLSVLDNSTWTNNSSNFTPSGGVFNDSATPLGAGDQGTVRLNANREMHVTCDIGNVMCALLNSPPPLNINGTNNPWTGVTPGVAQTGTKYAANTDQSSIGGTAVVADPCQSNVKVPFNFNLTSSANFITGTSGKKNYICSMKLLLSAAMNVSLVEYSGACTGGTPNVIDGSTTAANGPAYPANGGFAQGNGAATIFSGAANANTGYNVCALINGAGTASAAGTYVQQ